MRVESAEDQAMFFGDEFGCEALYAARDGSTPYTVAGIFDEPAKDFKPNAWPGGHQYTMQEGADIVSSTPTFMCRSADLVKGGKARDRLTIEGTVWKVQKPMPDGTGVVVLSLVEVDDE